MITTILSDFSRAILFPKDSSYTGTLNGLHEQLSASDPNYAIFDYFVLNEELLDYYRSLKPKCTVNIFTTGLVQNAPALREVIDPVFDRTLTAKDYGLSKFEPETFTFVANELHAKPAEILYIRRCTKES